MTDKISTPLLPPLPDYQEDYLRRTIQVKNKNIDSLLTELKQTQQLYQGYKAEYLSEQKKHKNKINQLTLQVCQLTSELDKYKQISTRVKGELQMAQEKEEKIKEQHLLENQENHKIRRELEDRCRQLMKQNGDLKNASQSVADKCLKWQDEHRHLQDNDARLKEQNRQLRQQLSSKARSWQIQRQQFIQKLSNLENKKRQKANLNLKLDSIQQKILDNLKKI